MHCICLFAFLNARCESYLPLSITDGTSSYYITCEYSGQPASLGSFPQQSQYQMLLGQPNIALFSRSGLHFCRNSSGVQEG
jgi:hypothetical protein